jgi:hypothetical protein
LAVRAVDEPREEPVERVAAPLLLEPPLRDDAAGRLVRDGT